jgi:glycosyltransferase involved in cell wall biosynthesis
VKSIGLCLIAKNEAHVITRCIDSALPLVDFVLVVDTGSTDDTPRIVRKYLDDKKLPGEVIHEPWRDFAHNRNVALRRLRDHSDIDYSLMLDADQILAYDADFVAERFKKKLRHDIYDLPLRNGPQEIEIPNLVSNRIDIVYKSELHEFRVIPPDSSRRRVKGLRIVEMQGGGRSRNPDKYRDDAALLEKLLLKEHDPYLVARHKFYLGESYRLCGDDEKALQFYLERAKLGFSIEEIFVSSLYAGRLQIKLNRPGNEVLETFLAGHKVCPWRAEALHGAAKLCRLQGLHHLGYMLATPGLRLAVPESGLYIENWVYDYGLLDEYSVLCYWTGRYRECLDAATRILREGKIPEEERPRVQQNADFAAAKLKEAKAGTARQVDAT